jgi:hypothetical protein
MPLPHRADAAPVPDSTLPANSSALLLSRVLFAAGFLAQIFVAWRFWHITWDDSAITLGFARTFAATGRIEPTPGSGIVEGYSTTLWMLAMTLAARVIASPVALLAFAKISTLCLNLMNIVLIRLWLQSWNSELVANLAAGTTACCWMFYETVNGMETPLLLALLLVMLLFREKPGPVSRWVYILAGCAFVLVRFEAVWLLLPFLVTEVSARKAVAPAASWLGVFAASCIIRFRYFGYLLPNTVYAKHGPPYTASDRSGELLRHLAEPWSLLLYVAPLLVLWLVVGLLSRKPRRSGFAGPAVWSQFAGSAEALRFSLIFVLFAFVLTSAIGTNWGPPLRSFYPAWPFLFALLFRALHGSAARTIRWATLVIAVFAFTHMALTLHEMAQPDAPVYMKDTTVDHFNQMTAVLGRIQDASRTRDLVYAGPDVGAVMLFSRDVRLVDLGLLCDPVLSHRRYAAMDSYVLAQRRPDVIEVHRAWTELSGFLTDATFLANYQPVYVSGIRVFLSSSRLAQIAPSRLQPMAFDASGRPSLAPAATRPYITYKAIDFALNRKFGRYYVLN